MMYSVDEQTGLPAEDKQPSEARWYTVDFSEYIREANIEGTPTVVVENQGDVAGSAGVAASAGPTIVDQSVKVQLSGGTDGERYKVTIRVTDDSGDPGTYEADFIVRVREY